MSYRYAKANNKYLKDYYQNKESSYLKNLAIMQKLAVNNFESIEDTSQFRKKLS